MKLWQKSYDMNADVEKFTCGRDKEFDLLLAKHDVACNLAHSRMLYEVGILTKEETIELHKELLNIYRQIENCKFSIDDNVEDIHSQIELLLTDKLGETGKKIHTARSRNDQVLTDIRLFLREELLKIADKTEKLFRIFIELSEKNKEILLPGYTHLQVAMPSSFGLWYGAYAESLSEDYELLAGALKLCDKSPLGSAAGFGSGFPIDRQMTADLLNFSSLVVNSVYCQMTRGKIEKFAANAIASIGATLSRLATDLCLYSSQNFAFLKLPKEYTTGSSIMPHKQNPDVFELVRARCNRLQTIPMELTMLTANMPSGYHRDYQLTKEIIFPAFKEITECIEITSMLLPKLEFNLQIFENPIYKYIGSVEAINKLVNDGMSFREAYHNISQKIEEGNFEFNSNPKYTHIGSIGNPGNEMIINNFEKVKNEIMKVKVVDIGKIIISK
jgi:argininosuccinate lyase